MVAKATTTKAAAKAATPAQQQIETPVENQARPDYAWQIGGNIRPSTIPESPEAIFTLRIPVKGRVNLTTGEVRIMNPIITGSGQPDRFVSVGKLTPTKSGEGLSVPIWDSRMHVRKDEYEKLLAGVGKTVQITYPNPRHEAEKRQAYFRARQAEQKTTPSE